jgi:hypothetical protein
MPALSLPDASDPCRLVRLVRQVKKFPGSFAAELIHLPGKPHGVNLAPVNRVEAWDR